MVFVSVIAVEDVQLTLVEVPLELVTVIALLETAEISPSAAGGEKSLPRPNGEPGAPFAELPDEEPFDAVVAELPHAANSRPVAARTTARRVPMGMGTSATYDPRSHARYKKALALQAAWVRGPRALGTVE